MSTTERLLAAGEIGGRTAQIVANGEVRCQIYDCSPLLDGWVRIRTAVSAISPGTEMTLYGRHATNVHLNKTWNPTLRLFETGAPPPDYPVTFGYRAAGIVVESRTPAVERGTRVYGIWHHTEFTSMPAERALAQAVPADLSWDDAVDLGHLGPICVNAGLFGEGVEVGRPAVVIGAGPVGLIIGQMLRANGARVVDIVDQLPSRLAIAADLGLRPVLATPELDVARFLKLEHGSEGIPAAWECTGSTRALHEAIRVVKRQGTVVAVGFYQGEGRGLSLGEEFHHNGVRVISGQIGNVHAGYDMIALRARTIELAITRSLVLGGLPRTAFPIEAVAQAFESLKQPDQILQATLTYGDAAPSDVDGP